MRFVRKAKRGVALIYFTLIFGVLLGFTMLIINTGLLIYQKIRLQSAVDMAAYAGASVQAAYYGGHGSGEQSIKALNTKIQERYFKLLRDLQYGSIAPFVSGFPDPGTCAVACQAANFANAQHVLSLYHDAVSDIENYHDQIRRILQQMPKATQKAVEETMKLNIPDLDLGTMAAFSKTTNELSEVLNSNTNNIFEEKKNAVLTFLSNKGGYLANVVSGVPHTFTYFGPTCEDLYRNTTHAAHYYCIVNGAGVGGTPTGYTAAIAAHLRGLAGGQASGNIGHIKKISDMGSNAIRLHFVEDAFKPKPFVVVAAEWYPDAGAYMNLESSFGATGSLFNKKTRLAAVSAGEPFGATLVSNTAQPFGVRLTGIRKVLLDPRVQLVRDDYKGVFDYMEFIGPRDDDGRTVESPEDVIRRFLH